MTTNKLVPRYSDFMNRSRPDSRWSNVNPDDIGEGFTKADSPFDSPFDNDKEDTEFVAELSNKFVTGSSEFVFFTVTPTVKRTKKIRKAPLNAENKLTPQERQKFTRSLSRNIGQMSTFFMEEILPLSMSINPAVDRVDEKTMQMLNTAADLPKGFIQGQATMAIQLRVVRFIAEAYGLNEHETALLRKGLNPHG